MLNRLSSLPIALLVVAIGSQMELSLTGSAVLAGTLLTITSLFWKQELFHSPNTGYLFAGCGLLILAVAWLIGHQAGFSLTELSQARPLHKHIRHLPFIGIAMITNGILVVLLGNLLGFKKD